MDGPEVPLHFLCPISLQIMNDPVIISTGVSYNRESIHRWLSAYDHNTCPVTNQTLTDRTLTPNSNLLRLIQSWASHPTTSITHNPLLPQQPFNIPSILQSLLDPQLQLRSLKKIRSLVQNDADITAHMEQAGVTSLVATLITTLEPSEIPLLNDRSDVTSEATTVLYLLKPSPELLKQASERKNGELVMCLSSLLQRGSCRARIHAALLLRSIFKFVDERHKTELPTQLFDGAVEILKDQNSERVATMAVLSILMEVVPFGRNRAKVVEAGAVPVIVELLIEGEEGRRCEAMLWVLEMACGRAEGRLALLAHPAGVAAVVGKILRVSYTATEKAVKVLLLLCRFCQDGGIVEEMMEVGGAAKLCMVVQVECTRKTRDRAKEILGMHMKTWSKFPCFSSYCLP